MSSIYFLDKNIQTNRTVIHHVSLLSRKRVSVSTLFLEAINLCSLCCVDITAFWVKKPPNRVVKLQKLQNKPKIYISACRKAKQSWNRNSRPQKWDSTSARVIRFAGIGSVLATTYGPLGGISGYYQLAASQSRWAGVISHRDYLAIEGADLLNCWLCLHSARGTEDTPKMNYEQHDRLAVAMWCWHTLVPVCSGWSTLEPK